MCIQSPVATHKRKIHGMGGLVLWLNERLPVELCNVEKWQQHFIFIVWILSLVEQYKSVSKFGAQYNKRAFLYHLCTYGVLLWLHNVYNCMNVIYAEFQIPKAKAA